LRKLLLNKWTIREKSKKNVKKVDNFSSFSGVKNHHFLVSKNIIFRGKTGPLLNLLFRVGGGPFLTIMKLLIHFII